MSQKTISGGGIFTVSKVNDINDNFTELYTGVAGEALPSPTITGTVAGGASYTAPTLTAVTITGTSTIANGMTITTPVLSGTVTGTYTLGGTPTITNPAMTASTGNLGVVGTVTSADATTPILATATGKTNTGYLSLTGKTSGSLKVLPADAMAQILTVAPAAQTVGDATLTIPNQAGVSSNFVFDTLAQTLTNKTITGAVNSDYKVLAGAATYSATTTPATLTGFSWTVVAGTYAFELNLPTTMTTVGGLTVDFALTTAVLTSIQYQSYASTASDNTLGVSTQGTTATSGTKVFDSKTSAYTLVTIKGSMVVGTGGTFAWQGAQNTSAGAGDATIVLLGAYAKLVRVA